MFQGRIPPVVASDDTTTARLDLLGRMPIPLRRPFRAGLERALAGHDLAWSVLMGGEWNNPFDHLPAAADDDWPALVVTPWMPDALSARLLDRYSGGWGPIEDPHPACIEGGLIDPLGVFTTIALIPMVFLVDRSRLGGRPVPRRWSDLLGPLYRREVVFGGWRPRADLPFTDYNAYLLLCLAEAFGMEAVRAFAASVKTLRHNVVSARTAGANDPAAGAVTVLPWMQAEMAPRRDRTLVVWPEDGAITMPIGCLGRPEAAERLRPALDYLCGPDLGRVLAANRYPAAGGAGAVLPAGARLLWPGWERVRAHDMAERAAAAGRLFFSAWGG